MRRAVLVLLSCALLVTLTHHKAFSQQEVTAKELSAADVQNGVKNLTFRWGAMSEYGPKEPGHKPDSIELIGIHQDNNEATVYCKFMTPHGQQTGTLHLIRFTSGKWYSLRDQKFLTK
jgi:hypothetical protein